MLTTSVTVSHKIQSAPYESAELSVTIDGIDEDTTEGDIEQALARGQIAYKQIRDEVRLKTDKMRKGELG